MPSPCSIFFWRRLKCTAQRSVDGQKQSPGKALQIPSPLQNAGHGANAFVPSGDIWPETGENIKLRLFIVPPAKSVIEPAKCQSDWSLKFKFWFWASSQDICPLLLRCFDHAAWFLNFHEKIPSYHLIFVCVILEFYLFVGSCIEFDKTLLL